MQVIHSYYHSIINHYSYIIQSYCSSSKEQEFQKKTQSIFTSCLLHVSLDAGLKIISFCDDRKKVRHFSGWLWQSRVHYKHFSCFNIGPMRLCWWWWVVPTHKDQPFPQQVKIPVAFVAVWIALADLDSRSSSWFPWGGTMFRTDRSIFHFCNSTGNLVPHLASMFRWNESFQDDRPDRMNEPKNQDSQVFGSQVESN